MENTMKTNHVLKSLITAGMLSSSIMLAGCGGSDDAEEKIVDTNIAPVVAISGDASVKESKTIKLTATASDSDGTIASYLWTVKSGPETLLTGANSSEVTITAPDVAQDTDLVLAVTVTDNEGKASTAEFKLQVLRKVSNVSISGLVTDQPIANAVIEIIVGEETFQTQADATGKYNVNISVDDSLNNTLVRINALGDNAINPEVEFVSQLGSVASLVAAAGDDAILDKEENFAVNITNVTTSEFALIKRAGELPTSDSELEQAKLAVDADEKLTLAAIIKIIVDNEDDSYVLPEGVNSTLDLVDDEKTANEYIAQVNEQDPTIIEETKEEIKDDGELVDAGGFSVVGNHLIASIKHYSSDARQLEFNEDKTGKFISDVATETAFTWQQNENQVDITLPEIVTMSVAFEDDGNGGQYEIWHQLVGLDMSIIDSNESVTTVEFTEILRTYNKTLEQVTDEFIDKGIENLIAKDSTLAITKEELVATWVIDSLYIDETNGNYPTPASVTVLDDGSASLTYQDIQISGLTWQLVNNQFELTIPNGNSDPATVFNYYFIKDLTVGYQFIAAVSDNTNSDYRTRSGKMVKQQDVQLTNELAIGHWDVMSGQDVFGDVFYEVYADGVFTAKLYDNSYFWHIDDSGLLQRERYRNIETNARCDSPKQAGCYLARQISHELIAKQDNTYHVIRTWKNYSQEGELYSANNWFMTLEHKTENGVSQFDYYWLDDMQLHQAESDGIETFSFETQWDNEGNVYLRELYVQYSGTRELVSEYSIRSGILYFTEDGEEVALEITDFDRDYLTVCDAGQSCTEETSSIFYLNQQAAEDAVITPPVVDNSHPLDGAWFIPEEPTFALVFKDGKWVQAQYDTQGSDEIPGFELGDFTWDETTTELSVNLTYDGNGAAGYDADLKHKASVNGDVLTLEIEGEGVIQLQRVKNSNNSLIGGFHGDALDSDEFYFTVILNNNTVIDIEYTHSLKGIYAANYTYDVATGKFTTMSIVDQINLQDNNSVLFVHGDIVQWKDGTEFGVGRRFKYSSDAPVFNSNDLLGSYAVEVMEGNTAITVEFTFNADSTASLTYENETFFYNWEIGLGQLIMSEIQPDSGIEVSGFIFTPISMDGNTWQTQMLEFDEPEMSDDNDDPENHDQKPATWTKQVMKRSLVQQELGIKTLH